MRYFGRLFKNNKKIKGKIMSENEVIKTIGENGEEIALKLVEVINIDNKEYALLSLYDENTKKTAEELVIMKMFKTEDECTFQVIEDDDEFEFVANSIQDDDEE